MRNSQNKQPERVGVALVVSGPSGTGKSTVCTQLKELVPELGFSISCTTRAPRQGEIDGREYYFISKEEFYKKRDQGLFIEYAEVHGNFYGTLKSEVLDKVSIGQDVLLDIDVQGALQIKKSAENDELLAKSLELVFIGPPSFTELERRLRSRATESEESIQLRLKNAEAELEQWQEYEYLIINNELENAVSDMKAFLDIMHKKSKRLKNPGFNSAI